MNIGIDIDGVLANSREWELQVAPSYFEKRGKTLVNPNSYYFSDMFGVSQQDEEIFWDEYIFDYAKEVKTNDFASNAVHKLIESGNKVVIITARYLASEDSARGKRMQQLVKNWIAKNKIEYHELVFSKSSKVQDINAKKIDIMIEDSPKNIAEISKLIPVICYDNVYNKNIIGQNILHASSWYDILSIIENFNKDN